MEKRQNGSAFLWVGALRGKDRRPRRRHFFALRGFRSTNPISVLHDLHSSFHRFVPNTRTELVPVLPCGSTTKLPRADPHLPSLAEIDDARMRKNAIRPPAGGMKGHAVGHTRAKPGPAGSANPSNRTPSPRFARDAATGPRTPNLPKWTQNQPPHGR